MCDIWRNTTRAEITPEAVAGHIAEWQELGVRRIVLTGGEALMHSRIWEFCDILRAADIGISILTTGLLLQRHAAELVKRCDDVVISLDGPQSIHDTIRNIPRAYERIREGVAAVKAMDARVVVSGRCTVQRSNFVFIRATVDAAHDLGLDRISFLAADVSTEAFNRPGGWSADRVSEVALTAADIPLLAAELHALEIEYADDFESGYIAETSEKLTHRIQRHFEAILGIGEFAPNQCNAPWVSAVVETDGTVRPCFFQPALGNLNETGSLRAVLNSPAARAWRAGLSIERDEICRKCVCTLSLREPAPGVASALGVGLAISSTPIRN